jgi:hypothetical protein
MSNVLSPVSTSSLPTLIGWQGVRLRVPNGWFFNGFSGNWREGVLQIASQGATTLDVKWVRSKKPSDLRLHLDKYLKKIEQDARKRKQRFTGRVETVSEQHLEFQWKSDRKGIGIVRRCPNCQCITLTQISGLRNTPIHVLAFHIFDTLQDCSGDGWNDWSLYGLQTAVPERFLLEHQRIMTGQTRLLFRYRREQILIERFAQAEQSLQDWSLQDWTDVGAEWRTFKKQVEEVSWRNHKGISMNGRLKGFRWMREFEQGIFRLHRPALRVRAALWHCTNRNQILHVRYQSPRRSGLLEQIIERTVCH